MYRKNRWFEGELTTFSAHPLRFQTEPLVRALLVKNVPFMDGRTRLCSKVE